MDITSHNQDRVRQRAMKILKVFFVLTDLPEVSLSFGFP